MCRYAVSRRINVRHDGDDQRRLCRPGSLQIQFGPGLADPATIVFEQVGQPLEVRSAQGDQVKRSQLAVVGSTQGGLRKT